jgi:hypothetical protein
VSVEDVELVLSLQLGARDDASTLMSDKEAIEAYLVTVAKALHPDFECTMRFPGTKPVLYKGGVEAFRAAWEARLEHWAQYRAEIEGVIDAETKIVVFHRAHVRRTPTSEETVLAVAGIWAVRDHQLVSAEFNVPQAEARAVAYATSVEAA